MATLDATQIPAAGSFPIHQSTASQSGADWDIDDAEEIPGEPAAAGEELAEGQGESETESEAAADGDDWNLDDGWETNIPVGQTNMPAGYASPTIEEIIEEAAIDSTETTSLVADSDPEAVVEEAVEVAASEEVTTETQPVADPQPAGESNEPTEETSDDILTEIIDAERECERTESVVLGLTARLKEAKENFKAAQNRLRELVRQVGNDSERPMVSATAKPAAKVEAADPDPDEDEDDDLNDEDNTDLEDAASEGESCTAGEVVITERGKPTRIRITSYDPDWPQIPIGAEHDVHAIEEDGTIVIQDPAKVDGEILLSPINGECEVIAWEELPVASASAKEIVDASPNSAAASQAKANEKNSRPEDDSWRKARLLEDIGLAPNLCELLESNPEKTIKTMGDLSDWTKEGRRLDEIPKIGPAKVTKIDEATDRFWAKWNDRK